MVTQNTGILMLPVTKLTRIEKSAAKDQAQIDPELVHYKELIHYYK
jgi:hypothetical protein